MSAGRHNILYVYDPPPRAHESEGETLLQIVNQTTDSMLPGDEEGRIYLAHWLFGRGEQLDLFNDPMWSQYMMAEPHLRSHCKQHLENDAKARARGENTSSEVFLKFHMDLGFQNGYRTGYEFLHQSAYQTGDFNILGGAIVTRSEDGDVTIRYLVKYRWNEYARPNPAIPKDVALARGVKLLAIVGGGMTGGAVDGCLGYRNIGRDFHMTIVWTPPESKITITKDGAIRSEQGWPF
jgi:hypothetical protein